MRGIQILVALAICLAPLALPAANRVGDANNDHIQNAADAALVQSRLYGTVTAAAVSPLALATNDNVLDLADLLYVAQIAAGARTGVTPRPSLLTLTPPPPAIYATGTTPNPILTFAVASNYPAATNVSGLDALAWSILEGAAVESMLANSAASVGASIATTELVPLNPAPPNDTVTVRLQIPILTSSGAASQTASAQRAMTVTAPFCGDGAVQPGEACDGGPSTGAPNFIGNYNSPGQTFCVAVSGTWAYVGDGPLGLLVLDITAATPTLVGSFDNPGGYTGGLALSGGRAYVADYDLGLQVLDIAQPNPSLIGAYDTPGSARDVVIYGDQAYVADFNMGLQVLDISATTPTLVGTYDTPGNALGVAVTGTRVYVADGASGLQVLDITTATPSLVGTYNTPGAAYDVKVIGTKAYIADQTSLLVLDISTPTPTLVGSRLTGFTYEVDIFGARAYVADGNAGLKVMDITSPTPTLVGTYDTPGEGWGIAYQNGRVYMADGWNGLQVLSVYPQSEGLCLADCSGVQICGDGVTNGAEVCDDGDLSNCTSTCNIACSGPAMPHCGNGAVDCGEVCDDGHSTECGVCNMACSGPGTGSTCGDGSVCADTEACDDGNATNCGLCNASCTGTSPADFCGDGLICGAEVCDDGFVSACGACNISCTGPGSGMVCGDGLDCDNEACDDGNTANCDGCSGDCQTVETDCPGSQCDGTAAAPSCWLDSQCAPPLCFDAPGDCYVSKCMGYLAQPEQIVISNAAMTGTLNGWIHNSATGSSQANNSGGAATSDFSPNSAAIYTVSFNTQMPASTYSIWVAGSRINAAGGPSSDVTLSVSLDGIMQSYWVLSTDNSWSWRYFGTKLLAAGAHTIEFSCSGTSNRSRCGVDGIFITSQALNMPTTYPGMNPYASTNWDDAALDFYIPPVLGHCDDQALAPVVCGDGIQCGSEGCDDGATGWICPGGFSVGDCIDCQYRAQCADGDGWWGAGDGCSPMGRIEPYGCVAGLGCMDNIGGFIPCPGDAQCFFDTAWQCVVDAGTGCCYGGTSDDCSPGNICDNFSACDGQECFSWQWGGSCLGGFPPCSFGQTCIESWPTYSCVP